MRMEGQRCAPPSRRAAEKGQGFFTGPKPRFGEEHVPSSREVTQAKSGVRAHRWSIVPRSVAGESTERGWSFGSAGPGLGDQGRRPREAKHIRGDHRGVSSSPSWEANDSAAAARANRATACCTLRWCRSHPSEERRCSVSAGRANGPTGKGKRRKALMPPRTRRGGRTHSVERHREAGFQTARVK